MNDNKSTVMNNAAVQQLRKVPGFDPMKLLRKTISVKTGHPVWKLDLRYKRLWFRLACPNGRMLLKPLRISDQLAIIEAQVYFDKDDPVPAASFTSEQRRENVPGGEFLRAAQGRKCRFRRKPQKQLPRKSKCPVHPLRRKLPQKQRRRWIWILRPLNSTLRKQPRLMCRTLRTALRPLRQMCSRSSQSVQHRKKHLIFMFCCPIRKKPRKKLQNSRRPRPIRQIWMSARSRSV